MKLEVILTSNIVGLGGESDHVKVAAGYARNYLFPQRLAIPLTQANKRRIEALKQRRAEREAHEFNTMTDLAKAVKNFPPLQIKVKTGDDGKMFGSVTAGNIADELKHQFDVSLDKRKIHIEHPIRTVGDHEIELRLHSDVLSTLKVHVESTTPLPAPEAPAAPAREERGDRRARRGEAPAEGAEKAEGEEKKPRGPRPDRGPRTDRPRGPRSEKPAPQAKAEAGKSE